MACSRRRRRSAAWTPNCPAMRGLFRKNPATRNEFVEHIQCLLADDF
jgi:GTP cyclohydrolase I